MSLGASILLYLLVGAGVATAVLVAGGEQRVFRVSCALLFWPLFVPMLLAHESRGAAAPEGEGDELFDAVAQADGELRAALESLHRWVGHIPEREESCAAELRAAWALQAERIRELDRLLPQPESPAAPPPDGTGTVSDRVWRQEQARRRNREQLRELRQRAYDDLMGSIARVRELASTIHLARFTGEPAARAEELVRRLIAAVEELSGADRDALQPRRS